MKRIISIVLTIFMLASISFSALAVDFNDFTSAHWAYNYVNTLVADGTINGFADGTFRPEETVTRAQFVKMIGNGPEIRSTGFDDVPASHWAYGYIMSSGLDALIDNMFMPDTPITRGDVAVLLWKRAGSPKGITAPPIVHRQSINYDAASWVYTNGIMVGDDYIDLRLGDTLTRAEASALIVRSREVNADTPKTNFAASIDSGIYEEVYNAFKLADAEYYPNGTLTNGELAMAAARLQSSMDNPNYPNVSAEITFEHKYAQPINMLARYYLGLENDNAAYADKNATMKEAIAAIMFATSRSAVAYIPLGTDGNYPTYKSNGNEKFDQLLASAYCNGILAFEAPTLDMEKEVTMKELSQLVLEFNGFSGFHRASRVTAEKTSDKNAKIRANTAAYPKNADNYRIILEEVPNNVYETAFVSANTLPKDSYALTNAFKGIFTTMLSSWVKVSSAAGYDFEVIYYPGLSAGNGNGYSIRCKINIKSAPEGARLADIIECANSADGEIAIGAGSEFFADIDTGKALDGVNIDTEFMFLSQVIR